MCSCTCVTLCKCLYGNKYHRVDTFQPWKKVNSWPRISNASGSYFVTRMCFDILVPNSFCRLYSPDMQFLFCNFRPSNTIRPRMYLSAATALVEPIPICNKDALFKLSASLGILFMDIHPVSVSFQMEIRNQLLICMHCSSSFWIARNSTLNQSPNPRNWRNPW